jgi:glycosyltransferase involved in cell wall biosynthesis
MSKTKILIGCLFFKEFTGSELYVYELSKGLINLNYDVSIVSPNIGGPLTDIATNMGIKVYSFNNPPLNEKFDLIHAQHTPVVEALVNAFPNIPKICTIHSEIISLENPVIHSSILKYIAIRPEIKKYILDNFMIIPNKVEVIYNPIDETRFKKTKSESENFILFVGTIDYLRRNSIFDLLKYAEENNKELWIVGEDKANYLGELLQNKNVKHFNSVQNIEDFYHKCSETGGILLGRTTIEGWMCGKSGWMYHVDSSGNIINKEFVNPPKDINKFYSKNVIKQITDLYKTILKK